MPPYFKSLMTMQRRPVRLSILRAWALRGNSSADLGGNFDGGWVNNIASYSFYIRNNPEGVPSLYQKTLDNNPDVILEGVEQMQITYGVDTNRDLSIDAYLTADAIDTWSDVISVRISLVMINIDADNNTNIALGDGSYSLEGNNFTPDDGRIRRVFTQTLNLYNRSS